MALLDRFRTKPAWQHEDPAVRAAAVRELPGEDQSRSCPSPGATPTPGCAAPRCASSVSTSALSDVIRDDDRRVRP